MIGCGKVGAPTANLLEELGYDVTRYDVAYNKPEDYIPAVSNRDLIFIAVPTPHDPSYSGNAPTSHLPPKNFDYTILSEAVRSAAQHTTCPIVIISTVLPGTIHSLFWDLSDRIVYNPFLIGMGTVAHDLIVPDIIILGTKDGQPNAATDMLNKLYDHMTDWNGRSRHLGTFEEAECIKIFYNTFISAKLSLVNMIQDVSQRIGNCNVDVVTNALKDSNFRITGPAYMTAGMGDGGPCHPRDNIALSWLAKNYNLGYDIFGAIMQSREAQARNLAKDLCHLSYKHKLDIYIHGETFKPGVPLCDGSYSHLVGHYVKEIIGQDISYIDPYTKSDLPTHIKGIVLLAHNHNEYTKYYCNFMPGSVIVDPWRKYSTNDTSIKVIHYGNTRPSTS